MSTSMATSSTYVAARKKVRTLISYISDLHTHTILFIPGIGSVAKETEDEVDSDEDDD